MYPEDYAFVGVVGPTLYRLMLTTVPGRVRGRVRGCGSGYGCGSACTVSSAPKRVSEVYLGGFAAGSVQTESKLSSMLFHLNQLYSIVLFIEIYPSGILVGQYYETRGLGLR